MALVGKARARRDLGEPEPPFTHKLDRVLQSKMHDVAVWRNADRPAEDATELKWGLPRYLCQGCNLDLFVDMGEDIVCEPVKHCFAQHSSGYFRQRGRVAGDQPINEAARDLIPVMRSV